MLSYNVTTKIHIFGRIILLSKERERPIEFIPSLEIRQ
jgi:hypothetical protein